MEYLTSGANTKDWINSVKGLTILGYIEPFAPIRVEMEHSFSDEDFRATKGEPRYSMESQSTEKPKVFGKNIGEVIGAVRDLRKIER